MINRETILELLGLLEEADYWVRETLPSEWRIFSRNYGTRGDFLKASKRVQSLLEKTIAKMEQVS
jgi:hypothetical protein